MLKGDHQIQSSFERQNSLGYSLHLSDSQVVSFLIDFLPLNELVFQNKLENSFYFIDSIAFDD